MEPVVQQLIKGQEKLEWALEQQLTAARADRELFQSSIAAQMEVLSKTITKDPPPSGENRNPTPHYPGAALQKYIQGEDPDAFLLNCERAARACGWPVEKWPFLLAPLLSGDAQAAYQVANPDGNNPYWTIKEVILDHLGLDAETYRVRFRKERAVPGENPKSLFIRLKAAADKWLKPNIRTKEDIMNQIYLEQFMEALPYGTQRWLRQHPSLTVEQAIEMATHYARAQSRPVPWESEKFIKLTQIPGKTERKGKPALEPSVRYKGPKPESPSLKGP